MTKGRVIGAAVFSLIALVILLVVNYLALPAKNIRSAGFWWYMILVLIFVSLIVTVLFHDENDMPIWIAWGATVVFIVLFAVLGLASSALFNSHALHDVAKVTVSDVWVDDFADLSVIKNQETLPLVDMDTAITLGDKKLAGIQHASWFDVDDEYNLIQYQGQYYRLSTIDYAGYFEYRKAEYDGIPGYVLVPVTPENGIVTQEALLVELEQPIRYTPGAFWGYDLRRHLRNQYSSYIFDDSFMEIDENGVPYWVTGVLRPSAGVFGGKVINSFILTNAQTGDSQECLVTDAPEWIDHIYSLDYLMEIAYWKYAYANGFWNNSFSKSNVWRTSYHYRDTSNGEKKEGAAQFAHFYGYTSIVNAEGEVCFYTGLTAANAAESNLGWLVIDTSTGEMTQYNLVGAEESSAQAAVEQLVQEKGYEATFPLPVNICGEASYLMCLKGKAGLVQSYAICNMNNYSIAVQADTLPGAIQAYQAKLGNEVIEGGTTSDVEVKSGSGIVSAVYTAEINGTTQFYYVVNGELYRSPITINERQVLYGVGTKISFSYYEDGNIRVVTMIE